jgi:hypothetical protein
MGKIMMLNEKYGYLLLSTLIRYAFSTGPHLKPAGILPTALATAMNCDYPHHCCLPWPQSENTRLPWRRYNHGAN